MFFGTVASNTAIDYIYIYFIGPSFFCVFSFEAIFQKGLNPRIAAARSMLTTGVLVIGVAWRFFRCLLDYFVWRDLHNEDNKTVYSYEMNSGNH